jgi:BASS family bile acid:Na+ symporter
MARAAQKVRGQQPLGAGHIMQIIEHYLLPAALFLLMFALGASLTVANFLDVLRFRTALLVGIASLSLLVPAIGLFIAHSFQLDPILAVGVVMTAACPGGTFSNLLTHYARGDLALSISLTALTSLAAVITLPLYVGLALAQFVARNEAIALPFLDTVARIFSLTVVPVALGLWLHQRRPDVARRIADPLKNLAAILIVGCFLTLIVSQRAALADAARQVWAPIVCLNLAAISTGFALSMLFRLPVPRRAALTIEHAIKQEGTGIYVAITLLGLPLIALPLLMNSVCGLAFGSIFTWAARRRESH